MVVTRAAASGRKQSPAIRQAMERFRIWADKPQVFARECLGVTPDPWQDEVLEAFPTNPLQALKASKGPGKTAVLTWLAWNFLLTRPHPKIAATSITADTLFDTLWSEMALWRSTSPLLQEMFEWTRTRIFAREAPETWFMSARPWSKSADAESQAHTLAGLHADYIMFLLDEAGGIPKGVMVAAEAAMSSCVEGHIVIAGNPTHLEGPLYEACTKDRKRWWIREITSDPDSPMRSPRVSSEWARSQIEKYGRDSPWVRVNVFGEFPSASINTLIGPDDVMAAMKRFHREWDYRDFARVLGVDVAREGDDMSVIFPRQGIQAFPPIEKRNIDGIQGAGLCARHWDDWGADACFIDNTGGWAGSWIDQLRAIGKDPVPVGFAGEALDKRYFNKRAEMYFDAVAWIKEGGALPEIPELLAALTRTTYSFRGDKFILEPKDDVKLKLGYSPDHADAFALTFAFPVTPKKRTAFSADRQSTAPRHHKTSYDPFAEVR